MGDEDFESSSRRDGNNPALRPSQNRSQLLEATMRNVPKLKELNYTQWKNVITNSIKKAKLWGYIDGSIEEPKEHDPGKLATYFDEAAAVRGAILGSLEYEARRYIEEALDPRDAWVALEKRYLTAEAEADKELAAIEQRLSDLRLEEGGDLIEHIAEFCRMRYHLNGTRLALDEQASISMLYRSLPPSYRQSVLTPERTEMKDFSALCARLTYLTQNPEPQVDASSVPVEDLTSWGVPEDIKSFGLTGDKNPLLSERAAVTCRDCLLKDHKAGSPECPQCEWRKELWGTEPKVTPPEPADGNGPLAARPLLINSSRLSYEFSEPVKVVLDFDELGLNPKLRQSIYHAKPSAIQQCAILPIIQGHNLFVRAPPKNGKTTALMISALQVIDTTLPYVQVLVFAPTNDATNALLKVVASLGSKLSVRCSSSYFSGTNASLITEIGNSHVLVGLPDHFLGLARRNMISMRKIRTMVLDDVDKLIEAGMEDQILELYRRVPSLAQVVASSTTYSLPISKTIARLLEDPLQISVDRNNGITIGTHIYVVVPAEQKPDVLWIAIITDSITCSSYGSSYENRDLTAYVALVTTDVALSTTTGWSDLGVSLVNYDVPDNVGDYVKRLNRYRVQGQMTLTFVAADTDEIRVVQELEECHGVHIAQLLWNPDKKQFY